MKKIVLLSLTILLAAACSTKTAPHPDKPYEALVNAVYDRLSVEDRAAQLFGIYPGELMVDGVFSLEKCKELIPYGAGHICQLSSSQSLNADELRKLIADIQDYMVNHTPAGIPAVIHDECITGVTAKGATAYPQQMAVACTWDPELLSVKMRQTARSMRDLGEQFALSPMVDIIRSAHWSRVEESYGEDGYLTATMGTAFVKGLQAEGFREGVTATTKHFLGYGGGSSLSEKEIYEEVLFPHEAIIRQAGSRSIMTCYDKFRTQYAVCSDTLLNVILRDYLGYDGIVVSDYGAVQQGTSYRYLPELLAEGRVSEAAFERAVKRALTVKARCGLLDPDPVYFKEGPLEMDPAESRQTAYDLAAESVVLLKNDGVLPLASGKTIALVGPNADSVWSMLGDYTYPSMQLFFFNKDVNPDDLRIPTLLESFQEEYYGMVEYSRGVDWSTLADLGLSAGGDQRVRALKVRKIETIDYTDWDTALKVAARNDVIVAAMGENVYLCGETVRGEPPPRRHPPPRRPGGLCQGPRRHRQAGRARDVQRPPANDRRHRRRLRRHPAGVLPRRGRRTCRARHHHGQSEPFRQALHDHARQRYRGSVLLQHRRGRRPRAVSVRIRPFLHDFRIQRHPRPAGGQDEERPHPGKLSGDQYGKHEGRRSRPALCLAQVRPAAQAHPAQGLPARVAGAGRAPRSDLHRGRGPAGLAFRRRLDRLPGGVRLPRRLFLPRPPARRDLHPPGKTGGEGPSRCLFRPGGGPMITGRRGG